MRAKLLLLFAFLWCVPAFAAPRDGMPQARRGVFAITNARIVTVTQGVIERGTVVIRGAVIEAVGADVQPPADAQIIDGTGLSVYPGLIDSGSGLGLSEISAVRETVDRSEIGTVIPHMQALSAINPNAVAIPVTRLNGVTTVLSEPTGGLFPGTSALIHLHGYTPEHMLVGDARLVQLEFPRTGRRGSFDNRSAEDINRAAERALTRLNETWEEVALWVRMDSVETATGQRDPLRAYRPELVALAEVYRGERTLNVRVDAAEDILKAIDWVKRHNIQRVVFSGVQEGWRVAPQLAEAGIACMVGPVLAVPTRESDRFDRPYANAGLLHRAGVTVAIRTNQVENTRNLPFHAGFAAAYGLGQEDALKAVTINPARMFGVDHLIGSIEVGKLASLIVTTGDPFETRTHVRRVFIQGYDIPLVSRQTRLFDEFLVRDPGAQD